jgi:hypothetical protein
MLSKLRQYSLYLVLLPVFFVLHGYLENYGFISAGELVILSITYIASTLILATICWLFFRNIPKAALVTFVIMAWYFFFGVLKDFLQKHTPFIASYTVLLGAFFVLLIGLIIFLKKTNRSFKPLTGFLNILFLIYILYDAGILISKAFGANDGKSLSVYSFAKENEYKPCDTCKKPDIYFILFDGYASSVALKKWYSFHNDLDSFLLQKKFSIQTNSRSNYNFTPFSMSSILNMSYIQGIQNTKAVTVNDYSNCQVLIRNNEVIKTLNAAGYDIVNYSIFNLAGNPSIVKQSFLPLNTRLITERTLFAYVRKDIGWKLAAWYPFKWFWTRDIMATNRNNQRLIELIKTNAAIKSTRPRFVYAHLYMPHNPFYYDKNGKLKDIETITRENISPTLSAYLDYIPYVNSRIREMVTSIQQQNPSAVIILMGDHGNREPTNEAFPIRYFQNLNAVYYPDNDYKMLYDSISGVNQFRVVLNKLLQQKLPLLKDSSIYLLDKAKNLPKN